MVAHPDIATINSQLRTSFGSDQPRNGSVVADGYGIAITVNRGQLVIHDGIGNHRRTRTYPRADHGLQRLVVIGHTGSISLEAARWLHDTGIQYAHIDVDGRTLAASTPTGSNNPRLRRAQGLAEGSTTGLEIVRRLLEVKLNGQAANADLLQRADAVSLIAGFASRVVEADSVEDARQLETAAAAAYFDAWCGRVVMTFGRKDAHRIPERWRTFEGRRSSLGWGSARNAATPINALLNYLYQLAELEARIACLTVGLDPGLGFLHADTPSRDSLALDLIEPVRPAVDRYLLQLLEGHVFRHTDFSEQRDGRTRILPPLTHRLADTLPAWRQEVAGWAELVSHLLADSAARPVPKSTPLTGRKRRNATSGATAARRPTTPLPARRPDRSCLDCGANVTRRQRVYCSACWPARRSEAGLLGSAKAAEQLDSEDVSRSRRAAQVLGISASKRRSAEANGFHPADYANRIQPALQNIPLAEIMMATGLSVSSASGARTGTRIPHPKHWSTLSALIDRASSV